jgi:hypothetical protein
MHHINVFGDVSWVTVFGWDQPRCSTAFRIFLSHMMDNWLQLINNRFNFWTKYYGLFAEAIRRKIVSLGDQRHTSAYADGGFNIFGFIDNKCVSTCRPGGGPASDGVGAARNDPLLQRAFYNGWKHHHGLKWQTVDLPNGMNYHVWGPVSLRHNDLYTYGLSDINNIIANSQAGNALQYRIYGDSAYAVLIESHMSYAMPNAHGADAFTNVCLSSCRETIEWNYGDLARLWKIVDWHHGLKLRLNNVHDIVNVAFIMRNAYVAMNGCQTSDFFDCLPPTFEEWLQGL